MDIAGGDRVPSSSGGGGGGAQFSNVISVSRLQDELRASKEEIVKVSDQIKQLGSRKRQLEKKASDIKAELKLLNESESSFTRFSRDDFPWSEKMMEKLVDIFNIPSFRSHQKTAINATMLGVDLLLVMPTGGGKSLCFQLPAVLRDGVTLVVTPLISLMEDQLGALQALGVQTEIFNAQSDRQDSSRIFQAMLDPKSKMKLLYVTPEKLAKSKRLMAQIEKMYRAGRFDRLVIDEVHCCSQWGHDFRPDYKFLGIMKTQYPKTPIIGLTATATSTVLVDIQKILNLEGCLVLRDSFYRPNLRYSVVDSSSREKVEEIASIIQNQFTGQSGIIYCLTVRECEEVSKRLIDYNIECASYHSQLEPAVRSDVQQKWSQNDIQVIVATVAFGMGINKLDVRFVIHHSMSKSVENYYQETGRAGRDGMDAECVLYYSFPDAFHVSCMMMTEKNGTKNVHDMLRYALDQVSCRKQFISIHFGDPCEAIQNGCNKCDNCEFKSNLNGKSRSEIKVNVTKLIGDILKLLDHASTLETRMTALKLMDAWFNKGAVKLRTNDVPIPVQYGREICEKLVGRLIIDGYLKEDFHFTPYTTISYIVPGTKSFMKLPDHLMYSFYVEALSISSASTLKSRSTATAKNAKKVSKKRKSTTNSASDDSDKEYFTIKKSTRRSDGKIKSTRRISSESEDDSQVKSKRSKSNGNNDNGTTNIITID